MVVDLPDLELDGSAGQERTAHLGGHAGCSLGLAGDQISDQHAAGEAEGAQALDDGLVELHVFRVVRIHMDQVGVTGQAVQQVLGLTDVIVLGVVRRPRCSPARGPG